MPPLDTSLMPWNKAGAREGQPVIFQLVTRCNETKDLAEIIVCNSFLEAEASAFKLCPNILPIGPLTGLAVVPGVNGVVTKEEVSGKVIRVVGDNGIESCVARGGSSYENFKRFVDLLKQ
ncbi:hypothetical protein EJB05_56875, partial [Eragrostis curvula]